MAISPLKPGNLSLVDLAQLKSQAFNTLLSSSSPEEETGFTDIFAGLPTSADALFEKYLGVSPASASPSGLDAKGAFGMPGQNMMTVLNRVDVSFKAQFSELSEMKNRIAQQEDAAKSLAGIGSETPVGEIAARLRDFISTYNAGVNRFAPSVAEGGVLEDSMEAERARFALLRDINNPLIGAGAGLKDGLAGLGLTVDDQTGLAALDEGKLEAALAQNKSAGVNTIVSFAESFAATTASLNKAGNPQDRQLANLDKAIHWIEENRKEVEQEFGPGEAARPTAAFSKAAAAYYSLMARQNI